MANNYILYNYFENMSRWIFWWWLLSPSFIKKFYNNIENKNDDTKISEINDNIRVNSSYWSVLSPELVKYILENLLVNTKKQKTLWTYTYSWWSYDLAYYNSYKFKRFEAFDSYHWIIDTFNKLEDKYNIDNKHSNINILDTSKKLSKINIKIFKDKIDTFIWCPPYFLLERYELLFKETEWQSTSKRLKYKDWLNDYWLETVKNLKIMLKNKWELVLIIWNYKNYYKKELYDLKTDMSNILISKWFKLEKEYIIGKKKYLKNTKMSESIFIFKNIK